MRPINHTFLSAGIPLGFESNRHSSFSCRHEVFHGSDLGDVSEEARVPQPREDPSKRARDKFGRGPSAGPSSDQGERRPGPAPISSGAQAQLLAHGPDMGVATKDGAARAMPAISSIEVPEVLEVGAEAAIGGRPAPPPATGATTAPPVAEVPLPSPTPGLVTAPSTTTPG